MMMMMMIMMMMMMIVMIMMIMMMQELKELAHTLLCHKLAPVQRVSLNILVGYKLRYLSPYKEMMMMMM